MATQREIAKYLDTNEHAIRELCRVGILQKPGSGQGYNVDVCRVAYIRHIRTLAKQVEATEDPDEVGRERQKVVDGMAIEKARQAAETADKLAMQNAVRRRELAPIALLQDYSESVGNVVRASLESLPAQCKRKIPHLRASEINIIKQECARTSDNIASFNVEC